MSAAVDPRRAAGMAKMEEVYGFALDPEVVPGRYGQMMVDHLFGTVWTDDSLGLRDRRLLVMGALAALDKPAALRRGELTPAQIREVDVHLTQDVRWPSSTGVYSTAEGVIAHRVGVATAPAPSEPEGDGTT